MRTQCYSRLESNKSYSDPPLARFHKSSTLPVQAEHGKYRLLAGLSVSGALKLLAAGLAWAACSAVAAEPMIQIQPDASAVAAVAASSPVYRHARKSGNASITRDRLDYRNVAPASGAAAALAGPAPAATNYFGNRYPGDLSYHGGPVVKAMTAYSIFVNPTVACPPNTCWGNPLQFMSDLGVSDFIHIVDQYVGSTSNNRYKVSSVNFAAGTLPILLTDNDILALVYAVATLTTNVGYGYQYHVFLPPGTDVCFDTTYTVCYSPGLPNTFYFCAYHGSVDFVGLGHVLYSVEPYQNVPGCDITGPIPNGAVADATNNVLSHEIFETITDPDGNAWWNSRDNGIFGEEIGDECSFLKFTATAGGFDPSLFKVGNKVYAAQPEYSNNGHTCATSL